MKFTKKFWAGLASCALLAFGVGAIASGVGADNASGWNPGGPECVGVDLTQHPDCTPPTTTGHTPVTICHHAGPNPADWHTITIDDSALPAHLAHGDTVGACDEQPPPTTTTTPTDTTPTDTTPTETTPPLGTTTIQDSGPKPPVEAGTTPKAEKAAKRAQAIVNQPSGQSARIAIAVGG